MQLARGQSTSNKFGEVCSAETVANRTGPTGNLVVAGGPLCEKFLNTLIVYFFEYLLLVWTVFAKSRDLPLLASKVHCKTEKETQDTNVYSIKTIH